MSRSVFISRRPVCALSAPAMFSSQADLRIFAPLLSIAFNNRSNPPARPRHAAHATSASWVYSAVISVALEPLPPPVRPRLTDEWSWHQQPVHSTHYDKGSESMLHRLARSVWATHEGSPAIGNAGHASTAIHDAPTRSASGKGWHENKNYHHHQRIDSDEAKRVWG